MERAGSDYPLIHLFDEPWFSTQDGHIGFTLDFFSELRAEGRLVLLGLHPSEPCHIQILREICERYLSVFDAQALDYRTLPADPRVRA